MYVPVKYDISDLIEQHAKGTNPLKYKYNENVIIQKTLYNIKNVKRKFAKQEMT